MIEYKVVRSRRRTLVISVSAGSVVVKAPIGFSDELIRARTEAATAPGAVQRMYSIFGSILDPNKEYTPLYARASKIRQETMLIWGRDDRMLPYEQAHFAFRQLPRA